ncbi:hypothetical protein [Nocardia sp. NPDC057272]|uniref:hypothetical protein n=1 Tax=Nocardia sp. NPDC057272 TaxID=3346079 RepID=UPI0036267A35
MVAVEGEERSSDLGDRIDEQIRIGHVDGFGIGHVVDQAQTRGVESVGGQEVIGLPAIVLGDFASVAQTVGGLAVGIMLGVPVDSGRIDDRTGIALDGQRSARLFDPHQPARIRREVIDVDRVTVDVDQIVRVDQYRVGTTAVRIVMQYAESRLGPTQHRGEVGPPFGAIVGDQSRFVAEVPAVDIEQLPHRVGVAHIFVLGQDRGLFEVELAIINSFAGSSRGTDLAGLLDLVAFGLQCFADAGNRRSEFKCECDSGSTVTVGKRDPAIVDRDLGQDP